MSSVSACIAIMMNKRPDHDFVGQAGNEDCTHVQNMGDVSETSLVICRSCAIPYKGILVAECCCTIIEI